MSHSKPHAQTPRNLELATLPIGAQFWRIYPARYPDPLGYGKTGSRFSDPRRRVARNRFGGLYLGSSLKVCFVETIIRDSRDGSAAESLPLAGLELWQYAKIEVIDPLSLVDLRGDGPVRMGVPSDVARGKKQTLARTWSVAFHDHPDAPDGIIYPSRLNEETNLMIYARAVSKLQAVRVVPLLRAPGFTQILDIFRVLIV